MPATRRCVHAKLASPPCSRGSTRRTRRRRRRRGLVTSLKPGSVAASPAEEAPHASSRRLRRGPAAVGSAGRAEEAGAQPRGDGEVGRRGARIAHVTQLRSNVDTESGCSAARTAARYARKATRTVSTHGGTRAAGVARPASRDTARAGRRPPRPGKTTASAAPSKACATRSSARAASCGRRRCVRKPAVRMPGAQVQVGQRGRRGEREARQQGGADGVARGRQVVEALRNLAAGTSQQVPRSRSAKHGVQVVAVGGDRGALAPLRNTTAGGGHHTTAADATRLLVQPLSLGAPRAYKRSATRLRHTGQSSVF